MAHQLRDCQYGIEAGDDIFAPRMKRLLLWAIAVRRRWDTLAASTQYQYRCRLYRQLEEVLNLSGVWQRFDTVGESMREKSSSNHPNHQG